MFAAILLIGSISVLFTGCNCKTADYPFVAGTIEEALPADSAPTNVLEAIDHATRFHQHDIMSDTINDIAVLSLDEVDQTTTEGYGIVVVKGSTSTTFPNIRNTRQPMARYDKETGNLWLTSSAMEGSGVRVEWLYQLRFKDNDTAYIAAVVNPYNVQLELCNRLGYSINDQEITLYDNGRQLCTVTNTVTNMGGFDGDQPIWIGEQLSYNLSGKQPSLIVIPGIKFTTGLVLTYDDMPEMNADVVVDDKGKISIGNVNILSQQGV